MRAMIGRILCFGLGALYTAGAVPLFTFGETGKRIWGVVEQHVAALGEAIGVWPWLLMWALGFFAVGGPLALVWLVAGRTVNRTLWFLAGVMSYGAWWMFGPPLPAIT